MHARTLTARPCLDDSSRPVALSYHGDVRGIVLLENPIRDYAWGSRTAIAGLLGEASPSPGPQAELWMGAHPAAPSHVVLAGRRLSLPELVAGAPEAILGPGVVAHFGPHLPFLAKLLAAAEPLSIQAHPDARQAREGFAREDALGIPLDSDERCYRDASHKPELLCALGPFEALRGFRPPAEIAHLAERLGAPGLRAFVTRALAGASPLRGLFTGLSCLDAGRRAALLAEAAEAAASSEDPALAWIARLAELHPGDAGALAPLFLHHLRLGPGEAIFLPPGELHTYLGGFAVEVMASSDNVLRGGLTAKHVDVDELLRILRFEPGSTQVLRPEPDGAGAAVYPTPAAEFELSELRIGRDRPFQAHGERRVEILLCVRGAVQVASVAGAVGLGPGRSCLVPAAAGAYSVEGEGALYRVGVPRSE
jgi:mannose-6-phosphate isomerase